MFAGSLALLALVSAAQAGQHTVYKGQWLCDDRGSVSPLQGMNVELWKRGWDWLPVEISGSQIAHGFTDAAGRFAMTTPTDDDNYFVRMALRDGHGVHLKDFWGINDWSIDTGQTHNDQPVRNYGGLLLRTPGQSHKCAIWAGVHGANEDFRAQTGFEVATHGVEIDADAVTAGVPFTPGTTILWPGGFEVGYGGPGDATITHHEFGHVIRHGFDGDFGHFLGDVVTYNYLQNHEPCNHTNAGYAFNEGWAEYWAGDYGPAPDCGRPGDMETEGNVAAALTLLAHECAGDQRKIMVENLRSNPGTIHSFAEFKSHLGCPIPLPVVVPPVLKVQTLPQKPFAAPISDAARAALMRGDALVLGKKIKGLTAKLSGAQEAAAHPPRCVREPCLPTLKTLTRPPGLQFQITIYRVRLKALKELDTKSEQQKLSSESVGKLIKDKEAREARERRKTLNAALSATEGVLAGARPVFRLDHSKLTARFEHEMSKTLARFRKAAGRGHVHQLPDQLTLTPSTFQLARKVPVLPVGSVPTPTPIPSPAPVFVNPLADSTLTIGSCPASVAAGKPIEVAGNLVPAVNQSQVKLTFSHPGAPTGEIVVTTDANGAWAGKFEPDPAFQTGVWTTQASFAGDASRKPASSQACMTTY
jgi:hypothetical protein